MTSNTGTITGLGVDSSDTVSITIGDRHQRVEKIAIERTAGDSTSYDVTASTDPDLGTGTNEDATQVFVETSGEDPANDPTLLENGGDGFAIHNEDGKVHVQITANGGTNGGNDFTVRIFY